MRTLIYLKKWHFDWLTSVITAVLTPILLLFIAITQRHLRAWFAYLYEGILYNLGGAINRRVVTRVSLRRYCRLRLEEDARYLYVPSTSDIKLEVDDVYVTLTLEHGGNANEQYDHTNILSLGSRIRVIGDPGSGKSSLVKRLLRDACYSALWRSKTAKLPVLVELKRLRPPKNMDAQSSPTWLFDYIRQEVHKSAGYKMLDAFDICTTQNGLLVLLDGLDEVAGAQYEYVQSAIDNLSECLAKKGANNTIVLTMRTQFHQQVKDRFRDSFGPALFLKPFSPTDIYTFLRMWPFAESRRTHASRIFRELTDRPSLREMCANPLVLAMYVAEDQAGGHVVAPESRTEFYKKVADELLIRRRLLQTGPAPASGKLREQRERILGLIAYQHMLDYSQSANTLNWSNAIAAVQTVMRCDEDQAIVILREVSKETGLITEERPGETLRFIHLTFCEFFCAVEAIQGQEDGWTSLISGHYAAIKGGKPELRSRLTEVIPFACGLMQRVRRPTAIGGIAPFGDMDLLARTFLETKAYDHEAWGPFIEEFKNSLLAVKDSEWDEQWLRNLHLVNVVVRDANQCATHMGSAIPVLDLDAFFRTLLEQQRRSLSAVFGAYARQDAAAAFRLAEVSHFDLAGEFPDVILTNSDQLPFLALVLEQAIRETHRVSIWTPLLTEAMLRSPVVAWEMYMRSPAPEWEELVKRIPRNRRWTNSPIFSDNCCTQCLSISVNLPAPVPAYADLSHLIAKVPPPGRLRFVSLRFATTAVLCTLIAILLIFAITKRAGWTDIASTARALGGGIEGDLAASGIMVSQFLLAALAYFVMLRAASVRIAYRKLLMPDFESIQLPTKWRVGSIISALLNSRIFLGRRFKAAAAAIASRRA